MATFVDMANDRTAPPHLLTTGETAARLCVSTETVRRWIRSGALAAVTLPSGHQRIRESDIDDLLRPAS